MDDNQQVADLDEALLIISLKNDEINNLKASTRTSDKKNAIRMTELQFKLDQEKARAAQGERKLAKAEESAVKAKQQWEEQRRMIQEDKNRLNEALTEQQADMRRKQREFKATIFQSQLQLQRERQTSNKLASELETLHRHFDPKKILAFLQKESLQDIPSYLQLLRGGLEKSEEVRQLTLDMERLKSETYLSIEESFRKLTSYEAVMQSLDLKNKELQQNIRLKEQELQLHSVQIYEKKQLLEAVKEQASQQVSHLSDQLHNLRNYVNLAPQQEIVDQQQGQTDYHHIIEELEMTIEQNEARLSQLHSDYEQKIAHLLDENAVLKKQIVQIHSNALAQKEEYEAMLTSMRRQIGQKDDHILLLNSSIREQENFFDLKQQEFDHYISNLNQLLRHRKKAEEESKENENTYKMQVESLTEELIYLRQHLYNAPERSISGNAQPQPLLELDEVHTHHRSLRRARSGFQSIQSIEEHRNLFADFQENNGSAQDDQRSKMDIGSYEQEPNWSELYYCLLRKHNDFVKKVQTRLQAIARRTIP